MGLLNSIIKTFVGDKTKKDLKQISPLVDKINKYQKDLESLNHDKLRKKTEEFKSRLFEKNKMLFEKVDLLKKEVETTDDIDEKENLYKEIDKLNEDIQEKTDIFLNEILPEAFAVIKETARRFVNNSKIKVKATTYDRHPRTFDFSADCRMMRRRHTSDQALAPTARTISMSASPNARRAILRSALRDGAAWEVASLELLAKVNQSSKTNS